MGPSRPVHQLGARERQILDALFRLEEGSVADVRGELPDPPSYSAVRTMIRLLESKGFLKHRGGGQVHLSPHAIPRTASKSAVLHVLKTFFRGSATEALAAILNVSSDKLTDDDLARMKRLIEEARRRTGSEMHRDLAPGLLSAPVGFNVAFDASWEGRCAFVGGDDRCDAWPEECVGRRAPSMWCFTFATSSCCPASARHFARVRIGTSARRQTTTGDLGEREGDGESARTPHSPAQNVGADGKNSSERTDGSLRRTPL